MLSHNRSYGVTRTFGFELALSFCCALDGFHSGCVSTALYTGCFARMYA